MIGRKRIAIAWRRLSRQEFSPESAVNSLHRIGIASGDTVLVHSSLSSLGFVSGGAIEVIETLRSVIGADGTLLFPTHSWNQVNSGSREFDVRNTPSCVGAISETFRQLPEAKRSLHPSHSVAAIGKNAFDLIRDHHLAATPCGYDTPYSRLLAADGKLLFLGVGLSVNTAFHTIEAMAGADYLMDPTEHEFRIIDNEGSQHLVRLQLHRQGVPRRFADYRQLLVREHILSAGKIGEADSMLICGKGFLDCMLECVEADALALVSSQPSNKSQS